MNEIAYPLEVAQQKADIRRGLEEHIEADHEVLKRIWTIHQPHGYEPSWCNGCTFDYPCPTIRAFDGAR